MKQKTKHKILLAERLRTLMRKKGINQLQLEKETALTNQAISLWLSGRFYPSYLSVLDLADYFDVTVDYLIGRED